MIGSYILLIVRDGEGFIPIGKHRILFFPTGWYVYISSALNGIENRVRRHLSSSKKMHWHIDYLMKDASIVDVFYKESQVKEECKISALFSNECRCIEGFGCSDCSCISHLFYGSEKILRDIIKQSKSIRFDKTVMVRI